MPAEFLPTMETTPEQPSPATDSASTGGPPAAVLSAVWFALVAVVVAGRLWQPVPGVTPFSGAAVVAGAVFPNPLVAASVPVAALAVSNLALPGYGPGMSGFVMAAVVYAALAWPVLLGAALRRSQGGAARRFVALVGSSLASSLVFFFATNFAHWCLADDYPRSPAGLLACFVAGLPFYRWIPVGDVVWTVALAAGLALLGRLSPASRPLFSHPANAA